MNTGITLMYLNHMFNTYSYARVFGSWNIPVTGDNGLKLEYFYMNLLLGNFSWNEEERKRYSALNRRISEVLHVALLSCLLNYHY